MITEMYKKALTAYKGQANGVAGASWEGCESEARHIYQIVMTEGVSVTALDEAKLSEFLRKEQAGLVDYRQYHDWEGLKAIDLEREVAVYPVKDMNPLAVKEYQLSALEAQAMIAQLLLLNQIKLLTRTLQSLSQRTDGTLLQSAFPSMEELKASIQKGLSLPASLLQKLQEWEALGADEVMFDFVEKPR